MLHWAAERCPATARLLLPRGAALGLDLAAACGLLVWQSVALGRHAREEGAGALGAERPGGPCLRELGLLQASFVFTAVILLVVTAARVAAPMLGTEKAMQALALGPRSLIAAQALAVGLYAALQVAGLFATRAAGMEELQGCLELHDSARRIFLSASLALPAVLLAPALLWCLCFCAGVLSRLPALRGPAAASALLGAEDEGLELGGFYLQL
mmetsp:Transcript_107647/g.304516  ORF Transcript_107647/g.304516 Transcript_107647/m.304516 type:complete len:213 (-) Transcript_107647:45-683(-)